MNTCYLCGMWLGSRRYLTYHAKCFNAVEREYEEILMETKHQNSGIKFTDLKSNDGEILFKRLVSELSTGNQKSTIAKEPEI